MRGIEFIDPSNETLRRHTANDWGLVMGAKVIGSPPPKEKYIELADRDGDLDFTDALTGIPAYGTRGLSFSFEYLDDPKEWTRLFTEIRNFLHGRRMKIFEPDDLDYYYTGRVTVDDPSGGLVKTFSVTVKADTWKHKATGETVVSEAVEADKTIVLMNDWRPVSPTITTTGAVSFSFKGTNYAIAGAGDFRFPKLRLAYGENEILILSGSGEITFRYHEGAI